MDNIETDSSEMLITLTSDIVAAHVSNNTISVEDVPTLISTVYGALSNLGNATPAPEERPEPAVTVVGVGALPPSGSVPTSRGRLEPIFTVASWPVAAGAAEDEAAGEVAAAGGGTGAFGFRLMVLVCRS